jgi:hypothetical protein
MESTSNRVIEAVRDFNKRHDELLLASQDGTLTVIQAAKLSRAYGNLKRALEQHDEPKIRACPGSLHSTQFPEDYTKRALHIYPVPEGWYKVSPRDTTNAGDRCWDVGDHSWVPVHAVNDYVSDYHCVIRQEVAVFAPTPAKRRGL